MKKIEYAITLVFLGVSILLKIGTVIALYKLYTHSKRSIIQLNRQDYTYKQ